MACKALEDRLAIRQQLNNLWKLSYRFAKRFEHGREMVGQVKGNHCEEWSEAMISCVQVEMECMMEDHTLRGHTSDDRLVSSHLPGLCL